MSRRSRLRPVAGVSPADWVVAGVGPFGSGVGAFVPHGFEAYARVLHPAWTADDRPVPWADVAAWSDRVVHPRVQFEALSAPTAEADDSARPWQTPPEPGTLPVALLAALCDVLTVHTTAADRCWFCVWDGYAPLSGPQAQVTFVAVRDGEIGHKPEDPVILPPEFPPSVVSGPRVNLPARTYLLLEGPLEASAELGMTMFPQSPNLFWPDDHAWCVATEIDLDSTYLGGSSALVRDVLADERLEALRVSVDDPVWIDSDEINR
ncbi:MAG TPA: hypothetical protein VF070_14355 [Streptosporangiaceae bacterium]